MSVTLTDEQAVAIAECLGQAVCGLGLADDCDEAVAYRLEDQAKDEVTVEQNREWARQWDIAIQFHNDYVKSGQFSDPWVTKELEEQLKELEA